MTEKECTDLTVTLKAHLEQRIDDLQGYFKLQLNALDDRIKREFELRGEALELAAKNIAIQMEHLNELREAFTTKEGKFATKDDLSAKIDTVNADIRALREWKALLSGRASVTGLYGAYILSVLGLVLAALRLLKG